MNVEEVRIMTRLSAGGKMYSRGDVLKRPFPSAIMTEIRQKTGTVKVLKTEPTKPDAPPVDSMLFTPLPGMVLAEYLRYLRDEMHVTNKALANKLGCSGSLIYKVETGAYKETSRKRLIDLLAKHYDFDPKRLKDYPDDKNGNGGVAEDRS